MTGFPPEVEQEARAAAYRAWADGDPAEPYDRFCASLDVYAEAVRTALGLDAPPDAPSREEAAQAAQTLARHSTQDVFASPSGIARVLDSALFARVAYAAARRALDALGGDPGAAGEVEGARAVLARWHGDADT